MVSIKDINKNIKNNLFDPLDGIKVPAQLEESVRSENRSYLSTVLGLAFRQLDVFGYFKFVTAVKNINLLPNRDSMMQQKRAKAFSNFAFKGIVGVVAAIYIVLFGLSFWQISVLSNKISDYDQVVQNHQMKSSEVAKLSKELGKLQKQMELSKCTLHLFHTSVLFLCIFIVVVQQLFFYLYKYPKIDEPY